MKNDNEQYTKKFEKQVNHLSGFVGMPVRNSRNPTLSEIRAYDRLVLEKQAQAFQPKISLIKRLNSSLKSLFITAFKKTEVQSGIANKTAKDIESRKENRRVPKKPNEKIESVLVTGSECCGL